MRKWAQATQRSTWPPNAAVRQRSIADMTEVAADGKLVVTP